MDIILKKGTVIISDERTYIIRGLIGRGANSAVYSAECTYGMLKSFCILKEYLPQEMKISRNENGKILCDDKYFAEGMKRFIDSGKMQNKIRSHSCLKNQTPPVSHIFTANGTAYTDVSCYSGKTLDKADDLTLPQYMEICASLARTVSHYHESGYLCLDIKPENIFVMQNAPGETITRLIEYIDFDSIYDLSEKGEKQRISYTKGWSAPEQQNPYSLGKVGYSSDIFAIGEIIFHILFGRHSAETEHRGTSKYPFEECTASFGRYIKRPEIQSLFIKIFRNTIRSSPANRFQNASELAELLDILITELNKKEYIIPVFPPVSPDFTGREIELESIRKNLGTNNVLFITGVGGIGKSTLVKNFIRQTGTNYDISVYLEFSGNIIHTFADDNALKISTVRRRKPETEEEYFFRKLDIFKNICAEKNVLMVIDNFSGLISKELSLLTNCGYDTIIVSRNRPPKNSFANIEIGAIDDIEAIFRLISLNIGRNITKAERSSFEEIIKLVRGHTLVIELIARQIPAGKLSANTALEIIRKKGFTGFSEEKIGNFKDGEEVYDTLSGIINSLFDSENMDDDKQLAMKILSFTEVGGLENELVYKILKLDKEIISELNNEGWLYSDDKKIRIHPVIAETFRKRGISDKFHDITVMEYYKKLVDIYVGTANSMQIRSVLKESRKYALDHQRHIIKAIHYDMIADYYDVMLNGAYIPCTEKESENIHKLLHYMISAINEAERSSDPDSEKYLIKYYHSLANVYIRSFPEHSEEAKKILLKAKKLMDKNGTEPTENHCYQQTARAWYHTKRRELEKAGNCLRRAKKIAEKVFPTEIEIIDIVYIPAADCFSELDVPQKSAEILEAAVGICGKYPDSFVYIDKKAELLCFETDIYFETDDLYKCRELIAEIDRINDKYKDDGIYREVDPFVRKIVMK